MNTLLSLANAALAYRRGRQTGLAGLFGIGIALLLVWQWGNILPILDAIGIVSFFDNLGLVYEGEPGLTGYAIFMSFVRLSILVAFVVFILLVIGILISMIFTNEFIFKYILVPLAMILLFPIIVVAVLYQSIFNRKKLIERGEELQRLGTPNEQLLRACEPISKEQAYNRLNRLPMIGDHLLIGVTGKTRTEEEKVYVVYPKPMNFTIYGKFEPDELICVELKIQQFDKFKHKKETIAEVIENNLFITKAGEEKDKIPFNDFESFYDTNQLVEFHKLGICSYYYKDYVKEMQTLYFTKRNIISNNLSNSTTKEQFDNLVNLMKMFDAPNEDIVRIMWESENTTHNIRDYS